MAYSKLDNINAVLNHLGELRIASENEGGEEPAYISQMIDIYLPVFLGLNTWRFATQYNYDNNPTTTTVGNYDYAYQLPSNYIKMVLVENSMQGGWGYQIYQQLILTNNSSLQYWYIKNDPAWADFPPYAFLAFTLYIASICANRQTSNPTLQQGLFAEFKEMMQVAVSQDANQGQISAKPGNAYNRIQTVGSVG